MNEQTMRERLHEYAKAEIGSEFDLWPRIRLQLLPTQAVGMSRALTFLRRLDRRAAVAVAVLLIVGVAVLTAMVPAAQAGVGTIVQRFGFVLVQPTANAPAVTDSPAARRQATPLAQGGPIPVVSLAEAQQQVAFHIPQPTWLPAGLALGGAHVFPPNWAQVFYRPADGSSGGLGIEITQGQPQGGYAFPPEAVQTVTVNGLPAVYAHGAGTYQGQWDLNADTSKLSWEADGFTFVVGGSGLHLSRSDLIRIAESLR